MKSSSVSVVIVNWNRKKDVLDLLRTLKRQNYPAFEIIVVDNASTDGSVEAISENFPDVNVIQLHRNFGLYYACKRGTLRSKGEK